MSVVTRYPHVHKLLLEVQHQVDTLASGASVGTEDVSNASQRVNALHREIEALRSALAQEHHERKDVWRMRVDNLDAQYRSIRAALERHMSRQFDAQREMAEREALFNGHNDSGVVIDMYAAEATSLQRSHAMIDAYFQQGTATLQQMVDQRGRLMRARSKVGEIAASLGFSDSLVRVIQRRTTADKYLVYGGIAVLSFMLWLLWRLRG